MIGRRFARIVGLANMRFAALLFFVVGFVSLSAQADTLAPAAPTNLRLAQSQAGCLAATGNVISMDAAWFSAQGQGPYFLSQANATYQLKVPELHTKGTAVVLIASGITFDLCGNTIVYDDATPIQIPNNSFESATGWNFSGAPAAARQPGAFIYNEVYDGNFALKFALPAADQYISSNSQITLEANTTYSLSGMFEYGGRGDAVNSNHVKGYVRLVGAGLPTREVSWSETNWRGIQLREGVFTTGASPETYTVQVGVEGGAGGSVPFYIDNIKIQRTRTYGVSAAAHSWAPSRYPQITRFGLGTNCVITNGAIRQGGDGATWAHGVYMHSSGPVTVRGIDVTVHGANSTAICSDDVGTARMTISDNVLTSDVKTITSRDNFDGTVMSGQGDIFNNRITNGVHAGIYSFQTIPSNIYGNTVELRGRYTNGFGILAGRGSEIHDNTIDCGSADRACRGIGSSGGPSGSPLTKIYNNQIHVQLLADHQEYEGEPLGGAYGMQFENANNVEVYNNDVYAYGNEAEAYAFRMNTDAGLSGSIYIHNNKFRAISGAKHSATVKLSSVDTSNLRFEDNELFTNDGIVGATSDSTVTLLRTKIYVQSPVADPYIMSVDWSSTPGVHSTITFSQTSFINLFSQQYLQNAIVRTVPRYGGAPSNRLVFSLVN